MLKTAVNVERTVTGANPTRGSTSPQHIRWNFLHGLYFHSSRIAECISNFIEMCSGNEIRFSCVYGMGGDTERLGMPEPFLYVLFPDVARTVVKLLHCRRFNYGRDSQITVVVDEV